MRPASPTPSRVATSLATVALYQRPAKCHPSLLPMGDHAAGQVSSSAGSRAISTDARAPDPATVAQRPCPLSGHSRARPQHQPSISS